MSNWLAELPKDPDQVREDLWPSGVGTHEVMLKLEDSGKVWAEQVSTEERRREFFKTGMIRGIADWIGLGVVYTISDLKTGRFPPDTDPGQTPQLLLYADLWLHLHPREPGIQLRLEHWPRYPKGALPTVIGPDFVTKDEVLEWHHGRLIPARRLAQKPGAAYDARPGPWCQYCRSTPWCPAQGGEPPPPHTPRGETP